MWHCEDYRTIFISRHSVTHGSLTTFHFYIPLSASSSWENRSIWWFPQVSSVVNHFLVGWKAWATLQAFSEAFLLSEIFSHSNLLPSGGVTESMWGMVMIMMPMTTTMMMMMMIINGNVNDDEKEKAVLNEDFDDWNINFNLPQERISSRTPSCTAAVPSLPGRSLTSLFTSPINCWQKSTAPATSRNLPTPTNVSK